jgi:hypothetical protein
LPLFSHGYPFLSVLSRCLLPIFFSRPSFPDCPVPAILCQRFCPQLSCPHCPVPSVMYWVSCLSV